MIFLKTLRETELRISRKERKNFEKVCFCFEKGDLTYFLELLEKDKQVIFLYLACKTSVTLTSITSQPASFILGFPGLVLKKASQMMFPWFPQLLQLQRYIEEIQDSRLWWHDSLEAKWFIDCH